MQKTSSMLNIRDYKLNVYIGISPQEKKLKQVILISVKIHFKNLPRAIMTDSINDTLCYHEMCNKLKIINSSIFLTIEHLCSQVCNLLRLSIKSNSFELEVKKFPTINNLKDGIKFMLNNFTKQI